MTPISIEQTTVEADTEEGTYVTHVVLFFRGNEVISVLELRTEFHPHKPKTPTYNNDEPDRKLGEFWD
mgnify:CR=1 FL=1